jgi:serine/threonine-protein kinase
MYVLLGIAAVAALAALAWGLMTGFGGDDVPQVTVPTVVGQPEQTAVAKIAQAKLKSEKVTEASDTVPAGEVISQNPAGGAKADEGSVVRITVSTGPTSIAVPDLRGLTLDEARAKLSDQGLELGDVEKVDDPDTPKDEVIDSNPAAGTSIAPGSKVALRVGTGKVEVPNVVGRSQNEAQRLLADANLQVKTGFKQTNSVPEGQVISQDPKDGTIEIGDTVKIVVAQKEPPVVTPTTATPTPTDTSTASPSPSASP